MPNRPRHGRRCLHSRVNRRAVIVVAVIRAVSPCAPLADAVPAAIAAGILSGAPSTLHALATRRDPLEATAAAGALLVGPDARRGALVAAALPVHATLSLAWATILTVTLPRQRTIAWGAAAGLAIAALDLGVIGRRLPVIRALPLLPQVADHVAFGTVTAAVLRRRRAEGWPDR
jgi:uncharacterized transporter YbjL